MVVICSRTSQLSQAESDLKEPGEGKPPIKVKKEAEPKTQKGQSKTRNLFHAP